MHLALCAVTYTVFTPLFDLQPDRRSANVQAIIGPIYMISAMTQPCSTSGMTLWGGPLQHDIHAQMP